MVNHAEAERILDFSSPTPLPGGGSWTAVFVNWEPDRLQRFFFRVTARMENGEVHTFEASVPDAYTEAEWSSEPARALRDLDWAVRGKLGIPLDRKPFT